MKLYKKILILFLFVLLVFTAAAALAFGFVRKNLCARDAFGSEKTLELKIASGTTARETANKLFQEGIIKNADVFYMLARFPELSRIIFFDRNISASDFSIKAGVCTLSSAMDAPEIYKKLSAGIDEQIQLSVPEGLTVTKIAERLEAAEICSAQDFVKAANDEDFIKGLGLPFKSAEGFLFPDTYFFVKGSAAKTCVQTMVENFFDRARTVRGFPLNSTEDFLEAVILASIVEREYRAADEAPLIAGVFKNRLKRGMRLESCATVEYVITEVLYRAHPDIITYGDLELASPYNTYRNAGLPPSPISNPGLVALNAAVNPAASEYLFFRLMDEEEGRHVFTKTFSEHSEQNTIFKTKKVSR